MNQVVYNKKFEKQKQLAKYCHLSNSVFSKSFFATIMHISDVHILGRIHLLSIPVISINFFNCLPSKIDDISRK